MANSLANAQVIATSTTSPKSNTEGKKVKVCQFKLSDIPATMRKKGWTVASKLMERWFGNPAWEMSLDQKRDRFGTLDIQRTSEQIDTTTVTMAWLLQVQFQRARAMRDQFIYGAGAPNGTPLWRNQEALGFIAQRLRRDGKFTNAIEQFGKGLSTPLLSHHCLLNERVAGSLTDPLDDLYGALGFYAMRVAGAGYIEPLKDSKGKIIKHRVHLEKVGLFVRDTYDFIGSQGLGLWNFNDVQKGTGYFNPDVKLDQNCNAVDEKDANKAVRREEERYFDVENADFQSYRTKFSKGGDFVIYSDVQWNDVTFSWDI